MLLVPIQPTSIMAKVKMPVSSPICNATGSEVRVTRAMSCQLVRDCAMPSW